MVNKKTEKRSGEERRRAKRLSVQDSFSLFLVLPEVHGMVRIYLKDVSRLGLLFATDQVQDFKPEQKLSLRIYTSPAFYLPVKARVVRVGEDSVAIEFTNPEEKSVQALAKLLDFLDLAAEAGEMHI